MAISRQSVLSCALAVCCGTAVSLASVTIRPVALTGTDGPLGPGMGSGVTFTTLDQQQPSVNILGQVAFRGNASTTGTPQGMWIFGGLSNTNVAMAGGAQPGGGTYTSGTTGIVNSMQINANGDWAMRLGASTGLFASSSGVPGRTMLGTDVAPGTGGATYSNCASGMPLFNAAGQSGYIANLTVGTGSPPVSISGATANAQGIWVGAPGATNLVARQNDAVLALDAGGNVRLGTFTNLSMAMNGAGRYGVTAALQGSVTTGTGAGSNASIIASNRTGSLEVIARVGNAAPDATGAPHPTDLFRSFGSTAIGFNDAGHVAFISSLRNAAGTQTAFSALYTDVGSGVLRQVTRTGDALPTINNAKIGRASCRERV